jgi:hypothetical protein
VLTAADAIAADAQLSAPLNTLDLPWFSNNLPEAERRKLRAQVRKLNALSLRTHGGAVFQSWNWVAARKEHSDRFGDTIFAGEDYLRCKRDFMGYGDYLLSARLPQAKGTGILKIAFDSVSRRAALKAEPGFAQLRIAQS